MIKTITTCGMEIFTTIIEDDIDEMIDDIIEIRQKERLLEPMDR